jgi:hypothetical protein
VPALLTLALCFFLPALRGCGEEMISPASFAFGDEIALSSVWIVAPFLVAALLAALTLASALRAREPGPGSERAAVVGLAAAFVLGVAYPFVSVLREGPSSASDFTWLAWLSASTVLAAALFARARRRTAWTRWAHLVAAFTALASPLCIFVLDALASAGPQDVGPGGWLYLASIGMLAPLGAWGCAARAAPA